jgi:hypothetical protein
VFAVLAFLAVMPVVALATVEPLLPMEAARSKSSVRMEMGERSSWSKTQGRRRWWWSGVNSYPSATIFISFLEIDG